MKFKRLISGLAVFLGVIAMAAGKSERVYVGTGGDGGIHVFDLDMETGKTGEVRLAAKAEGAGFLVRSADGKFLYAASKGAGKEGGVSAFAVKEDGGLRFLNEVSSKGRGPCMVALDETGKVCLVANYGSGSVAAFAVGEDGKLAPSDSWHQHKGKSVNERRQGGPHAHSIYAGPENEFVYAADLGTDEVVVYRMDAEKAALERVGAGKAPPGAGPRHMKFGTDGKRLYVLNEMGLSVSVFLRGVGGKLTLEKTVSVLPEGADGEEMTCSEIVLSSEGRFVYTATRDLRKGGGRDVLSVFRVGEKGVLELVETVGAEVWIPRNINIDPSGNFLLVAGQNKGGVPVFAIERESGKLSFTGERAEVARAMCVGF